MSTTIIHFIVLLQHYRMTCTEFLKEHQRKLIFLTIFIVLLIPGTVFLAVGYGISNVTFQEAGGFILFIDVFYVLCLLCCGSCKDSQQGYTYV